MMHKLFCHFIISKIRCFLTLFLQSLVIEFSKSYKLYVILPLDIALTVTLSFLSSTHPSLPGLLVVNFQPKTCTLICHHILKHYSSRCFCGSLLDFSSENCSNGSLWAVLSSQLTQTSLVTSLSFSLSYIYIYIHTHTYTYVHTYTHIYIYIFLIGCLLHHNVSFIRVGILPIGSSPYPSGL